MIRKLFCKVNLLLNDRKKRKQWAEIYCTVDKKARIKDAVLEPYVNVTHHAEIVNSHIGQRTSIGRYSKIRDSEIGAFCSISWDVTIGAVTHPMVQMSSHAFTYRKQFGIVEADKEFKIKTTIVGNDVWIGCGSIILAGVRIGDGSIIGAGAVVTKDVAPYTIVTGVPARVLRKRFPDEITSGLLDISWWNWDDNKLKKNIELLEQPVTLSILERLKEQKERE